MRVPPSSFASSPLSYDLDPAVFYQNQDLVRGYPEDPAHYEEGSIPVLVTSVHGFPHQREHRVKASDAGSLELSRLLAKLTGAHWLSVMQPHVLDSNWYAETPFKQTLERVVAAKAIQLVLDIHTAHAFRPFDVELGSLLQRSWGAQTKWRDMLIETVEAHGFLVSDNQVFKALGAQPGCETVVGRCYKLGVPAVQLEISSALLSNLDSLQAMHAHAKLVNALRNFIQRLN